MIFYTRHGSWRGGCGPKEAIHGGRRRWGPFEVHWEFAGDPRASGGGRGGRRMFDGGELRLILLALISDQPRHGYDLIREIEERTGGAYAPSPGVVYPTLTLLADMGLIEEQASAGSRKQFAITEAGTAHLEEHAEQVTALMGRLAEMGNERRRDEAPSVRRAMGNLRHAVKERVLRGDLGEAQLHEIADLLDEVARKIERMK